MDRQQEKNGRQMTKTYTPRAATSSGSWYVVDADGQTLGRLATRVARLLVGKHKPGFATHIDTGDHVIVVNAGKIRVTGDKLAAKMLRAPQRLSGRLPRGALGDLLQRRPEEVIRRAVKGMLPHNKLGVQQLRKLKVYAGTGTHPHEAQRPEPEPAPAAGGPRRMSTGRILSAAPAVARRASRGSASSPARARSSSTARPSRSTSATPWTSATS